ncbi:MAG: ribonuclease D [Atopobium sp.]|uniref:ribonuclease D n=1 Tax=Atopobium sp. TaxID=1872650 RepID=UPI002A83F7BD|nr:ribonuclease D [Atopobium sp.]MDY4522191.1 ribonuclease D [Atopobium sp.]
MYISESSQMEELIARARAEKVVAVDTEFLREKTFYPRLCLIQIGTSHETAAIDPLLITDLTPVKELLTDESVIKVFHACSQDMEVIDHALGVVVHPIFDTQVAAAFLGHRMQMGYGALVETYTGVHLPKAASLTDWSHRPLDADQLEYAEDDVRYLPGIYEHMTASLIKQNRLGWVMPEIESLCDARHWRMAPREAYHRLKRSNSLTRKQLSIARELCAWRDSMASARDIPRKWVLSDETVIEICKLAPSTTHKLQRIRGTEQLNSFDCGEICKAVATGLSCPSEEMPSIQRKPRPSSSMESVLDLMYALVRMVAEKSGVATQLISTRDDLYEFAIHPNKSRLSQGWRYDLVGKQLRALLDGQTGLTVKDGHIEFL